VINDNTAQRAVTTLRPPDMRSQRSRPAAARNRPCAIDSVMPYCLSLTWLGSNMPSIARSSSLQPLFLATSLKRSTSLSSM
jgi:hypothetical protein